jgi:hypothetical protein
MVWSSFQKAKFKERHFDDHLNTDYGHTIELKNNKLHGLLPPGGSVSPPDAFASLFFDQAVP